MKKSCYVLFILFFSSTICFASENNILKDIPEASPSNWLENTPVWQSGRLDAIYIKEKEVVVEDVQYKLSNNIEVYSSKGIKLSLYDLSSGDKIKYVLKAKNRGFIIKIIK